MEATGYKGFYYHFLDMKTGRRVWKCELSTVDTTFLLAGMLTAAAYFGNDSGDEHEIRTPADELYRRADWRWAQDGGATITHGWKQESGFLPYRWQGYDEALLLVPARPGLADVPTWVSPWHCGRDQGPIALMIENFRSGCSGGSALTSSAGCAGLGL